MTGDVSAVLSLRNTLPAGLPRLYKLSFGIHLLFGLAVVGWQAWTAHVREESKPMTINLGSATGPTTSGMTQLGGRQVDVPTPEPKRPTPIPAVASKPEDSSVTTSKPVTKPTTPKGPPAPTASVVSAPSTGRQVTTGSSVVETGTRGEGSGLAQGGGGSAGAQVDPEFEKCCKDYVGTIRNEVTRAVQWKQDVHGTVIIQFDILANGSIPESSIKLVQKSADLLNIEAQSAIMKTKLPPLPAAYTHPRLTVVLTIPF